MALRAMRDLHAIVVADYDRGTRCRRHFRRRSAETSRAVASQQRPPSQARAVAFVAGVVATSFMAILSLLALVGGGAPSATAQTRAVCGEFGALKSAIANGSLTTAELGAQIAALEHRAANAVAPVHGAFVDLAAADGSGSAAFLVAQTAVADACAATNVR